MSSDCKLENYANINKKRPTKMLSCAIITPIGPNHFVSYTDKCLPSVKVAIDTGAGPFDKIDCIPIQDLDGHLGPEKARNMGVKEASKEGYDWIFFLDANDILYDEAFNAVENLVHSYDCIWGATVDMNYSDPTNVKLSRDQLIVIKDLETLILNNQLSALKMGHFVKTSIAIKHPFEDNHNSFSNLQYFMNIWRHYNCIKFEQPLFINVLNDEPLESKNSNNLDTGYAIPSQENAARFV